jgi:hypothetical protein
LLRTRDPVKRARREAELECPPLPHAANVLWRVFMRLRRRKGSNGFAASPIEWPDIDAFLRLSRLTLTPWEIEIVEGLDDLFLKNQAREATEE